MKRICCITYGPPSNLGGAEVVWSNLIKYLCHFSFDFFTIKGRRLLKSLDLDRKNLHIFPLGCVSDSIPNLAHLLEVILAPILWYKVSKSKKKYSVIIYDKILGWCASSRKSPRICYNHGSYVIAGLSFRKKNLFIYLFYKYFLRFFECLSYQKADLIIAVSESVKEELIHFFGIPRKKIFVINNGVDSNWFKPLRGKKASLRKMLGLPINKILVLFPARPSYGKGFDVALKVARKLGPDFVLVVTGNGGKLSENTLFLGKVSHKKMLYLYNAVDLVILPSRYEGCNLAILEAAACGCPIVASPVGLLRSLRTRKLQKYICRTEGEFVKVINLLVKNRKRWIEASKDWLNFSKNFTIERQVKEFKKVIDKVIKNGKKS